AGADHVLTRLADRNGVAQTIRHRGEACRSVGAEHAGVITPRVIIRRVVGGQVAVEQVVAAGAVGFGVGPVARRVGDGRDAVAGTEVDLDGAADHGRVGGAVDAVGV